MKRSMFLIIAMLMVAIPFRAENIGVPAECEDVMLQAFYWDSYKTQTRSDSKYGRTKWTDLLADTAAIGANFELVWFPPSASSTGGVGYYHAQLSNQNSEWGTQMELKSIISALHKVGTRSIADIVINHRGNKSSWCDFWPDEFSMYGGTFQLTQEHICRNDECFTDPTSSCYGSSERGAYDTGTNDGGCRDLDHTNEYVQKWAKAYLKYMKGAMKFDGWRYDMTLGYDGQYLSMYNESSQPYLSVSEYWEGIYKQVDHLKATNFNTMIFDFPLKYQLHNAIVKGSYGLLKNPSNSLRGRGYAKYAVTFIDNHDTFERDAYGNNQYGGQFCDLTNETVKANILQAYAYILMMPGVPCVFYPHWKSYENEINEMIAMRKKVGIHSESEVTNESTAQYAYEAMIAGHRGNAIVRLGKNRNMTIPEGYYLGVDGDYYTIYLQEGQGVEDVQTTQKNGQKFMQNGRLYIRCGEQVYDAMGREVK